MNKILTAAAALMFSVGVAQAETAATGAYVTGSVGGSPSRSTRIDTGLGAGYQVMPMARVELDYDHAWMNKGSGNLLMANAIGQYQVPGTSITPYVLGGVGAGFDNFGQKNGEHHALYNVGGGVRIAMSATTDVDVRYRNVRSFDEKTAAHKDMNVFTLGLGYKF